MAMSTSNTVQSQRGGRNYVNDTVDDALALMTKLRRRGIRAHWWI